MGIYDFTLYDVIQRNAVTYAERPAWLETETGTRLTFSQYRGLVDRLASGLQSIGIQKGDRIGVISKNNLEFFLLYGAAAATGAIMLPINWRLSAEEVLFNLKDCEPKILFVDADFSALLNQIRSELKTAARFFNIKDADGPFEPFNLLMETGDRFTATEVRDSDGWVIIHTAAVEGRPRGAVLSHGNVVCANMHFHYHVSLTPEDVHFKALPLFHVAGLFCATAGFHSGALNVNVPKFEPDRAVTLIEAHKISYMFDFSPILGSILEAHAKTDHDISSLRAVIGLDTPETIEAYQKTTGGTFFSMYGQTETSCLATFGRYGDRPGSAGKTLPMVRVQLVDEEDRPLPPGSVGEITVKGPMVFNGYWNQERLNARTLRGGWHHTGDLGRFDEDGFLWYAGRKAEKELIKPGGENVYPAEVEKVILQHPAVAQTVVFGVPDPKWKEGIKAVCQLKKGGRLTPEELIAFVGERIARYKKPQYVEIIDEFPKTADGKPDRSKVKALYGAI